jgi:hypothetical protein
MPASTDSQDLPLGADHLVLLIAPAHTVNEIVERPALALGFPHNELRRVQFYHVELQPLATRRELHGQAFRLGNKSEMLRQCQHCFAALKLAAATQVRPRFASLQRDIQDFPAGIGRMHLHKGFVARYREVALHLDIANKLPGQAKVALAEDADAAITLAEDAAVAVAPAGDAGAALAGAFDADAAVALARDAGAAVAGAMQAGAALAVAPDAGAAVAPAGDAGAAVAAAVNAEAALALAGDAAAHVAPACDAGAAVAVAVNAEAALALAGDAGAVIAPGFHAVGSVGTRGFDRWRLLHAAGKVSWSVLGHTHCLLLSLHVPSREVGLACRTPCSTLSMLMTLGSPFFTPHCLR